MMHDLFLNRGAPLYGRARKLLEVPPMDYSAFCQATRRPPESPASFEAFACVGGIPRYWELIEPRQAAVALADALYFGFAPFMDLEPQRLLRDEGVAGLNAVSVLEAIGRGAERPSEIAARLGTAQTNLSRVLQQLLDAAVIVRELPFGETVRSTRRLLYRIADPSMRFWFRVYSPHRSRWSSYDLATQRKLVHDHAATVFEDYCRAEFPGAQRYWENALALDLVAPDPATDRGLLVAEVKWPRVSASERKKLLVELAEKWSRCRLRQRHARVRFQVLDASLLGKTV
jgi:hypothetical protein